MSPPRPTSPIPPAASGNRSGPVTGSAGTTGTVTEAEQSGVQPGSTAPGPGVTLAVLMTWPLAFAGRMPESVKVTLPLAAISTGASLMDPVPEVSEHLLGGALATQRQVNPVKPAGRPSLTMTPAAASVPPLETVIVNVIGCPAAAGLGKAVLVTRRDTSAG